MLKHINWKKRIPLWATVSSLALLTLTASTLCLLTLRSEAFVTLSRWGIYPTKISYLPEVHGERFLYHFEIDGGNYHTSGVVTFSIYDMGNSIHSEMTFDVEKEKMEERIPDCPGFVRDIPGASCVFSYHETSDLVS